MNSQQTVPRSVYRRHLQRARSQGDYFLLSRSYARTFGRDLALFLSDLINLGQMKTKGDEEWFECTVKDLRKSLNWDDDTQNKHFRKLQKLELVQITKKGSPPKRQVRIFLDQVELAVDTTIQSSPDRDVQSSVDTDQRSSADTDDSYILVKTEQNKVTPANEIRGGVKDKSKTNTPIKPEGNVTVTEENGKFFRDQELGVVPTRPGQLPFDAVAALQLRKALVQNGKAINGWKRSSWTKEMELLRANLNDDQTRIESVLDWFCEHMSDQYTPVAASAKTFRTKFTQIEAAYIRWVKANPQITETEQGQFITDKLMSLQWPKITRQQLRGAVEVTLKSFKDLAHTLRTVEDSKLKGFVQYVLGTQLVSTYTLVVNWFTKVFGRIVHWDKWSGQILTVAWDGNLDNKEINQLGASWSSAYSGDTKLWELLKEKLK